MRLSPANRDALTELANIGISRAARQLSVLLGEEILVHVPVVDLCASSQLYSELGLGEGDLACIYQGFRGGLRGRAALLLNQPDRHSLLQALLGDPGVSALMPLDAYEQEALLEIGNILISSCISAMADMLNLQIDVAVPRYAEARLHDLLNDLDGENDAEGLLLRAQIRSHNSAITGEVFLLLSVAAAVDVLSILSLQLENEGNEQSLL